jgi:hypothetical protein
MPPQCLLMMARSSGGFGLETLFAFAIAVGTLKAYSAPPPPPKAVAAEQREIKSDKPRPRAKTEPSIGF